MQSYWSHQCLSAGWVAIPGRHGKPECIPDQSPMPFGGMGCDTRLGVEGCTKNVSPMPFGGMGCDTYTFGRSGHQRRSHQCLSAGWVAILAQDVELCGDIRSPMPFGGMGCDTQDVMSPGELLRRSPMPFGGMGCDTVGFTSASKSTTTEGGFRNLRLHARKISRKWVETLV